MATTTSSQTTARSSKCPWKTWDGQQLWISYASSIGSYDGFSYWNWWVWCSVFNIDDQKWWISLKLICWYGTREGQMWLRETRYEQGPSDCRWGFGNHCRQKGQKGRSLIKEMKTGGDSGGRHQTVWVSRVGHHWCARKVAVKMGYFHKK